MFVKLSVKHEEGEEDFRSITFLLSLGVISAGTTENGQQRPKSGQKLRFYGLLANFWKKILTFSESAINFL